MCSSDLGIYLGTTITAFLLAGNRFFVWHVGDSRLYKISSSKIERLTNDHTVIAKEVAEGRLTEKEAKNDPKRNVLLQCIGASERVKPDMFCGEVKKGDILLLCSDGFRHEIVCQQLRQYCEANHESDRFLIHHGNLSASYRESAEEEMKDDDSLISICATATLELGIDIGRLERAFQIDAPFTVSGFLQRLGRTGRRGAPSEMWFVMREDHPEPRAMMPEMIPWYLIQGIVLVQLYVEEKFVEPPRLDRLPYSLLYHQTMSTLASMGEMTPAELASRVLSLSAFRRISRDDFRLL